MPTLLDLILDYAEHRQNTGENTPALVEVPEEEPDDLPFDLDPEPQLGPGDREPTPDRHQIDTREPDESGPYCDPCEEATDALTGSEGVATDDGTRQRLAEHRAWWASLSRCDADCALWYEGHEDTVAAFEQTTALLTPEAITRDTPFGRRVLMYRMDNLQRLHAARLGAAICGLSG